MPGYDAMQAGDSLFPVASGTAPTWNYRFGSGLRLGRRDGVFHCSAGRARGDANPVEGGGDQPGRAGASVRR